MALESGRVDRILTAIDAICTADEETLLSILIALDQPGLEARHQRDLGEAMRRLLARQEISFWQDEAAWLALEQVDVGSQYECNMMSRVLLADPSNARALDVYVRASLADELPRLRFGACRGRCDQPFATSLALRALRVSLRDLGRRESSRCGIADVGSRA